jgi:hypothetical protein
MSDFEKMMAALPEQWAERVATAAKWCGKRGSISLPCHLVCWAEGEINRLKRELLAAEREA